MKKVNHKKVSASKRPSWDEFWFTIALMYSTRGTCSRLRTATLIIKDKRIIGAGYNGSPKGTPHCDDVGHLMIDGHCERTLHGETNALLNADRQLLQGSEAYLLGTPCLRCLKELIAAGIKTINVLGTYSNSLGKEHILAMAKEAGVKLKNHKFDKRELLASAINRLEGPGGSLS